MRKKKIIFLLIVLFFISGCSNKKTKQVYTLNEYGDYIGPNIKIEYNENEDITLLEIDEEKEIFNYEYDELGNVKNIKIDFYGNVGLSQADFEVQYYDNGKLFSITMYEPDGVKSEQYFLYNDEDELIHILLTSELDGSLMSKCIAELKTFSKNGKDYILEKVYNATTGEFSSGRVYEKDSMNQYHNNLEKLGIITPLMYAKDLIKLNSNPGQLPNVYQLPTSIFLYSGKVLATMSNQKYMGHIFDENNYYVYSTNSSLFAKTLYLKERYYQKEVLDLTTKEHTTYQYTITNSQVGQLELIKETLKDQKVKELNMEYQKNNKLYHSNSFTDELLEVVNTKIKNVDAYYYSYLDAIHKNGIIYDAYKKEIEKIEEQETVEEKEDMESSNHEEPDTNVPVSKFQATLKVENAYNNNPVTVFLSTSSGECKNCTYDLSLNGKMIKENAKYDDNFNDITLTGYQVGTNQVSAVIHKSDGTVYSLNASFQFDFDKIPTPTFSITEEYNTYNEQETLTIWEKDNGCNQCGFNLYINGVKRKNLSDSTVLLEIGDNTFRVELENKFGKKSCKKVIITRYPSNYNVPFTQLGKYQISDC